MSKRRVVITGIGIVSPLANGREATLTVGAFDEARTREQLQRFGPARIEVQSLNLEDAFVETVGAADREVSNAS